MRARGAQALRLVGLLVLLGALGLTTRADARVDALAVTVTAYHMGVVTASGTRPRQGIIALSRDVEGALGVHFGAALQLGHLGIYRFEDRMPRYWHRRVDLYLPSRRAARQFGIRHGVRLRSEPGG